MVEEVEHLTATFHRLAAVFFKQPYMESPCDDDSGSNENFSNSRTIPNTITVSINSPVVDDRAGIARASMEE